MRKTCCGFGHRKIYERTDILTEKLFGVICRLVPNEGVNEFMIGEMGEFDSCFSAAVTRAKKMYPEIKLILVEPYFMERLNTDKEYYAKNYDDVIIPMELLDCHYKRAINKRNLWMVDRSEYVVSYVRKNNGGAFDAISYAQKCRKHIVSI